MNMAQPSNKGQLATQDKNAVNTEKPVKAGEYVCVAPFQLDGVQSEGLRRLHRLMNTEANPMSLTEVMSKVMGNAIVTAFDSKVAARHRTAYKYNRPSMTEDDFLDAKMDVDTRKFHKELLATRRK
jgi:hypothetical protein